MFEWDMENNTIDKMEETTFKDLQKHECDLEELLRHNIDLICGDEESMLIVGQQVKNDASGISDLTAVDNNGDIVLIEIKRDKQDIKNRREAFEFQAIRYAASYATLKSKDELIQEVFAPYVEKHKGEFFGGNNLTSTEIAERLLDDFWERNAITDFNRRQRIILVASQFDEQTGSAVAWLNKCGIDIGCYRTCLYRHDGKVYLDMKKILPLLQYDDFYVGITGNKYTPKNRSKRSRLTKPTIKDMLKWDIVHAGDVIGVKDKDDIAILQSDGSVKPMGSEDPVSMQQWLKTVMGWASVDTYNFAVHQAKGKLLSKLREEYMAQHPEEDKID